MPTSTHLAKRKAYDLFAGPLVVTAVGTMGSCCGQWHKNDAERLVKSQA